MSGFAKTGHHSNNESRKTMKGKVLDFNSIEKAGVISGDDGARYKFTGVDWKSETQPRAGQAVDFEVADGAAQDIYADVAAVSSSAGGGVQKKVIAALFAFFLGAFGAHKFYLGYNKQGVIMLLIFIFGWILLGIPSTIIAIVALVEAILYISKSDEEFERTYITGRKPWF